MFKVDDYVMYGNTGVCKVTGITQEKFSNQLKEYYVLTPVYNNKVTIKIPVDNPKISIREVLTEKEITNLLINARTAEAEWIENDRVRSEHFKSVIKGGKCEDLIQIVRAIYLNNAQTKAEGKKAYKIDAEITKEAERLINEEFSTVLNISQEDVTNYIINRINN
ncbi:MAG: CarD family transcriptional regulator [Clostridium sp.]